MTELQQILFTLKATYDYTPEELSDISEKIRGYAWACLMDSEVRQELEEYEDDQFN